MGGGRKINKAAKRHNRHEDYRTKTSKTIRKGRKIKIDIPKPKNKGLITHREIDPNIYFSKIQQKRKYPHNLSYTLEEILVV